MDKEAQMGQADALGAQQQPLDAQKLTSPLSAAAIAMAESLRQRRQPLEAAAIYRQALDHSPRDMRLHNNLGDCLWLADHPWEALAPLLEASRLDPLHALPQRGLANVLRDLNRFEKAEEYYLRSWQLAADPTTAWSLSQILIGLERFAEAFRWAECRFAMAEASFYRPKPYWQGPQAAGALAQPNTPLYIWSEQGFGDTFQYLRWLKPLCSQPGHRVLEVPPPLVNLLREGLSWLEYPPLVEAKQDSPAPIAGSSVSLLSLPHHLGGAPLSPQSELAGAAYLRIAPHPSGDRLGQRQPGAPRVGLAWAAGRKEDDCFTWREFVKRSLPAEQLLALSSGLEASGAELHNLQFGPDADLLERAWVGRLQPDGDFLEQARLMANLDLVISVDTATAHLAGAMGLPCWLLLPFSADPRWLRKRQDSVWYPTMKLFRQSGSGDWRQVVTAVVHSFKRHAASFNWLDP